MIEEKIVSALQKATGNKEIQLETPENEEFGDFTTNVALQQGNGKNPRKFAEEIVEILKANKELKEYVEKIEVAGPGFINFWISKDILLNNLIQIDNEGESYGKSKIGEGTTVIVDYSAPNIAKPFGIGHLRSTIIGQSIYNLYKFLGYKVIGDNHLGDWGTQFGKLLYMIKKEELSDFDIKKLEELYVRFHELASDPKKAEEMENEARKWFKKLEDNDPEARDIWKKCVDISMKEFEKVYELLNVSIDECYGESFYQDEMAKLLDKENKKVWSHARHGGEGAWILDLNPEIKTPLMLQKSDGATTYATRDLATIKFRVDKWHPAKIIYEVGGEQKLHFQQVFAAARLIGLVDDDTELVHVGHGLYLAPDGKKFATRQGKSIKLEEVLLEAIKRAKKIIDISKKDRNLSETEAEIVSNKVGIGAVKYFDLSHNPESSIVFDWDGVLNMEGNSGPYIQYTYARTNSVKEKSSKEVSKLKDLKEDLNTEEKSLLRAFTRFPGILVSAAKNYSPSTLCSYLYDLSQKYNAFYNKHKIIDSDNEEFRLAVNSATGKILKRGLNLLGIQAPERM